MYKNSISYRNCEICGKRYKIKQRQVAHQKYCSHRCYLDKKKEIYWKKKKQKPNDKLFQLLNV